MEECVITVYPDGERKGTAYRCSIPSTTDVFKKRERIDSIRGIGELECLFWGNKFNFEEVYGCDFFQSAEIVFKDDKLWLITQENGAIPLSYVMITRGQN